MINATLSRFATHENSAYPQLWRGCVGAWCPSLGPSGARLHDYSRRMNWGTLTNMDPATDWVVSGGAYGLDFDGSDDVVTATNSIVPGAGPFTVSLWFDGKNVAQFNSWVGQRPSNFNYLVDSAWTIGQGNYNLAAANTKRIGVLWYNTQSSYRVLLSDGEYADRMRHYAFVVDNSAIRLFVDGTEASVTTTSVGSFPSINTAHPIGIGALPPTQPSPLAASGVIDDVRIYNRALSIHELQILARRRGIAFTPRPRTRGTPEQAAGGATPWLYARRRSQIIGSGGVH